LPLALEHVRGLGIRRLEGGVEALLHRGIADQNEIPGLHEADGRGVMGGLQDPGQNRIGNGIGPELAAHVAPGEDAFIDRGALGRREGVNGIGSDGVHEVPFHGTA
jgi:hypothetical protein